MTSRLLAAFTLTIATAIAIGVWAEFADLGRPQLISVALPAIALATLAAAAGLARTTRGRAIAALASGVVIGTALGVLGEGTYLALHYARGGTLNFEGYNTQREMALALLGIHTLVGLTGGVIVGACLAAAFALAGTVRPRTPADHPGANPWTA